MFLAEGEEGKQVKEFINKLKCRLGFHNFQYEDTDERFMPKVRVLLGKCSRCPTRQDFFQFLETKKVVVANHGIDRIFKDYTVMPLEVENK